MVILPACSNLSANCNGTPPLHECLTGIKIKLLYSICLKAFCCVFTAAIAIRVIPRVVFLSQQLSCIDRLVWTFDGLCIVRKPCLVCQGR